MSRPRLRVSQAFNLRNKPPARCKQVECVSVGKSTPAPCGIALERAKGFEPSTPTLAKLHYTYSIIRDSTLFL